MENKNVIIFGANGQDGYYMNNLLELQGYTILKLSREHNVGDFGLVKNIVAANKPKYIFHFAANSSTRHDVLFDNHESISTGTINILEAVKLYSAETKVFLSGSAMQFKNSGIPIDENTPFEASSPYSFSRIHSVYAGRYYREKFGIQVYVGYFFNHDSPLRTEKHVNKKIIQAVKEIAGGRQERLVIGNLDVRKEFNYAEDIVEAVWTLVNQNNVYEAVIGSGKAYSIKEWLVYCFEKMNLNWEEFVILDESFTPEYSVLVSNSKLIMSLGWEPKVSFHQLANMMLHEKK